MLITIILKQKLESLPPVINLVDCLIDLGVSINLVCTDIDGFNYDRYIKKISIKIIKFNDYGFRPFKIFSLISFRREIHKYLESSDLGFRDDSFVWLASAEASLGVGHKISKYKFVFQCHELYDKVIQYKIQNKFYFQNSILNVCPESNRAAIFRYWYNLTQNPFVLVNAPYFHPKEKCLKIDNPQNEIEIYNLKNKKIILYMGQVSVERDITPFAKAIDELGDNFHLLVMGAYIPERDYIENLKKKFKNISFINGMPSPSHLQVASWAYIGILSYSFIDLNNVFCAPSKVWEYSGFGIPVISNDIPGIASLLQKYKSGIAVNIELSNINNIKSAILEINSNHGEYCINSQKMFDSTDFKMRVNEILNKLK